MSDKEPKPNCYQCVHRGSVPGSCHSSCRHPQASLTAFFIGENPLGVTANAHGIRKGWFVWPMDFDPVWLETCSGFEVKPAPVESAQQ